MNLNIKEKDFLIFLIGIGFFLCAAIIMTVNSKISSLQSLTKARLADYKKANVLYDKIRSQSRGLTVFKGNILVLVQKLESIPILRGKFVSANSLNSTGGEGVELRAAGLNMNQLIILLNKINEYNNLSISRFVLKKNFSSHRLVDINITIRKNL